MNDLQLEQAKMDYERDGFAIVRNVIDSDLIAEADQHVRWLMNRYPDLRPEHLHHPLIKNDAFWVRLVTDPNLLKVAETFLGPNVACFTAHYICKPPHTGQPVLWHQDGAYWNLNPMNALAVWLAVDESNTENGCLRMIRGTHVVPLEKPEVRTDVPNMLYSETRRGLIEEQSERSEIVDIVLHPGDISIHHPQTLHCSEPNRSSFRRCGLDIGYINTSTSITNKDLYLDPILVKGEPVAGINTYRQWPLYDEQETIPFAGHQDWNRRVLDSVTRSQVVPSKAREESAIETTYRMIERLQAGTVK